MGRGSLLSGHRSLARTWLNFTLDCPSCFPLILCSQTSGSASAPSVLWGTAEGMLCGLLLVFELGLLKLASFFPVSHRPHPSMSPAPVSWWPHRRSAWVLWPDELSFTRGQNAICGLHTTLQRLSVRPSWHKPAQKLGHRPAPHHSPSLLCPLPPNPCSTVVF